MSGTRLRVGLLATHPIQYYVPWYRALAKEIDLEVFYSHRQTADGQAAAGFGVEFAWDVPLFDGYHSTFLRNTAARPGVEHFWGCVTPDLAGMIRERAFDAFIVHGWSTFSYWQAIRACWRTGTPVLVRGDSSLATPRSWWRRAIKFPVYCWFIPRFDGYLVVGKRAQQYLIHYGADPARCIDTPHAVDNAFFASGRTNRQGSRQAFGLSEDAVAFLFVGKLVDGKEGNVFVEAIRRAAKDQPNICGVIVGDGPLRAQLESQAARSAAPVKFVGFLNQTAMVGAYAASDVLVVPSRHETWGLVVNEAMASGLPAIVSRGVGCAEDLVIPGVTGEVFEIGAENELVRLIQKVAMDGAYRRHLGLNARRHVDLFDVTVAASGTVRAVRELEQSRRSRTAAQAGSRPSKGIANGHDV